MAGKKSGSHYVKKPSVKKTVTFKDLPKNKQILYIALGAAAVVIFLALIVLYDVDYLPHLDGSLNFRNGSPVGIEDNSFVINRGKSGYYNEKGSYYLIGSLDFPEGFVPYQELVSSNDPFKQSFAFKPQEDMPLNSVAFVGCTKDFEELISAVLGENSEESANVYSERFDRTSSVKGLAYHGSTRAEKERNEENGYYYKYANAYVETGVKDSCIMVQLCYKTAYRKDIPSDEECLKVLDEMIDRISLVK